MDEDFICNEQNKILKNASLFIANRKRNENAAALNQALL